MKSSLFRPEALEARQQAWLGGIQLLRPLSLTVLTVCAAVAATSVVAYLFLGEYTRKARVPGVLVPDRGLIRLLPQEAATVVERNVREGQKVAQGEVLFVLSVDRATAGGDAQAEVRRSLDDKQRSLEDALRQRQDLLTTQRTAVARQLADRRAELAQIDAELRLQQQRLALAKEAQARLESLRADNFISSAQVQAKSEEVLAVQAQLAGLTRQRAAQQREIGVLEAEERELPLRAEAARGELQRDLATVAQEAAESEAKRRIVVRAPADGVLGAVLA
ncbi:MAG TPA: hypothetical protein VJM48_15190, partial [Methylibium sp.]|nr:hypothetical protein [Methylibium sp.]